MDAAGIILADTGAVNVPELIRKRTLAAIPFGARYRLIDFVLSNMTNSGISNVGMVARENYQSLMVHTGSGAVWDLERKSGGRVFLPPFSTEQNTNGLKRSWFNALMENESYLRMVHNKYVLITSCIPVMNVDYNKMLQFHEAHNARMTIMYTNYPMNAQEDIARTWMDVDREGRVSGIDVTRQGRLGGHCAVGAFLMEREDLLDILGSYEGQRNLSFRKDVVPKLIEQGGVWAYGVDEIALYLDTLPGYLASSLSLLRADVRQALFHSANGPVITKVSDSAPTHYGPHASVVNSLIADGAVIEGNVSNSIIFRGVHIGKDAIVSNSVVMQDSTVSDGARLDYAVLDKSVYINSDRILSGYITHPFFCKRDDRI